MPVIKSLNHLPFSPIKVLEEEAPMKQGIVTILRSDCERNKAANSIRRTLSADMSSKKWFAQNGFLSTIKKIVSSEVLVIPDIDSSSSESEEECEKNRRQDEVWRSIQSQKERNEMQKTEKSAVWGSILTQKSDNSSLPPPYVHPLMKRSASALNEKSLEICTESLGSETGSDCFSSSEFSSDADEDKEDRQRVVQQEEFKESNPFRDMHVVKYKKSPARPFPPPLPSIAGGDGVASVHMHSHRENGRLVLEAVSVPSRNYFHAQRGDGRLVLTLIRSPAANSEVVEENKIEEFEKVFDNMEEVDDDDDEEEEEEEVVMDDSGDDGGYEEDAEEEEEEEVAVEQNSRSLPSGMISVHKSGLVRYKNPTWSNNFNKAVKVMEADEEMIEEAEELQIPQSLPPPPRVARLIPKPQPPAAASFNAYEYFWRNKTTVSGGGGGFITTPQSTNLNNKKINGTKAYGVNQDLVLMRGNKAEYFVGCKEPRRSLVIWEPCCIATS